MRSRFDPPDRPRRGGLALSAEFLLGIIVGAATVFVAFGIFGLRGPGLIPETPVVTDRPTFDIPATPRPTPTPRATPTPTLAPTATPTLPPTPPPSASSAATLPPVPAGSLAGTWSVVGGSSAGYRITLHVPIFGTSQVAGTTQAMSGTVTVENVNGSDQISAARFSGDLRQLKSTNSLLDRQVSTLLKTDQFPTSDFELVQPIPLPSAAAMATPQPITLHGNLSLQGVNRPFDVPATIQLAGTTMTITAGVDFKLSTFGVPTVVGGGIATVDDAARFEFVLALSR